MIQSAMGNEIEILAYSPSSRTVTARRLSDNAERTYTVDYLKADGGIKEINEAIERLPEDCKR